MIPHSSKVLITIFLLAFYVNDIKSKKQDIFSIIEDNVLQRKIQFTINNDSTTIFELQYPPAKNGEKLLRYLSLVSDELNELNDIEEQKFKEESVSLQSAYIELSDEIIFHDINFDDLSNFKKAAVKMETIIPDGSDVNTIQIVYESKINEMVLSGFAEINGTDYDFVLNITDLTLREEYEKTPSSEGKIVTKSILEKLTFKKFTMLIVLTDENIFIRSPNRPILRQLADSWLVTVINVINRRFVQPRITEQSHFYFKNYKNTFLEGICSSVLTISGNFNTVFQFEDYNLLTEDSSYDKYSFQDIMLKNISSFTNCTSKSISMQVEKGNCQHDEYYSHTFFFTFTHLSTKKSTYPFLQWTLRKSKNRDRNGYEYRSEESISTVENYFTRVKYWSVKLTVVTDKYGHKTDDSMKVNIDIEVEQDASTKINRLINKFIEPFQKSMGTLLKSSVNQILF